MTGFRSKKAMSHNDTKHALPHFKIVDSAIVDDEQWYTVRVYRRGCMNWIRESKAEWKYEHSGSTMYGNLFDVHEKLFTMMALTWNS